MFREVLASERASEQTGVRILKRICLTGAFYEAETKVPLPAGPIARLLDKTKMMPVEVERVARRTLRRGRCTTMQRRLDK